MVTQNQLDPIVQKAVGRTATPYEVQTFSTLSPQALASLPEYYSGLNKNTSIVDYLKFNGQDPNSRIDLGKQYGITNIGTAEGNTALLNSAISRPLGVCPAHSQAPPTGRSSTSFVQSPWMNSMRSSPVTRSRSRDEDASKRPAAWQTASYSARASA